MGLGVLKVKKCPREGTRVKYNPNPASAMLDAGRHNLQPGATGSVTTVPLPGGRKTCMAGPGGGLVYVRWDDGSFVGVSRLDLEKAKKGGLGSVENEATLKLYKKCLRKCKKEEPKSALVPCLDLCNGVAGIGGLGATKVEKKMASSGSLEALKALVAEFYYTTPDRITFIDSGSHWQVMSGAKLVTPIVVRQGKRFVFGLGGEPQSLVGLGATKVEKKLDKEIEQIYYRHASGVQVNIMDIGKIFRAGRDAHARGEPMEPAIVAAIQAHRVNGFAGLGSVGATFTQDKQPYGPSAGPDWAVVDTRSGVTRYHWFSTQREAEVFNGKYNAGFVQHRSVIGARPWEQPGFKGIGNDDEGEPEEDDITTSDHQRWYQSGKLYHTGSEAALKLRMARDKFWPNVWSISDHGNAHLITLNGFAGLGAVGPVVYQFPEE